MAHGHSITRCDKCDTVISQCRCMSLDKLVIYKTCEACKLAILTEDACKKVMDVVATTTVSNIRQELREAKAREVYLRYQLAQLNDQIKELEKNNER